MTNDYRSQKTRILSATATQASSGIGVRVESDGSHAARMDRRRAKWTDERDPAMSLRGTWTRDDGYEDYQGRKVGAYRSTLTRTEEAGASVELRFDGSAVAWIGPRAPDHGKAHVYVDGQRVAQGVDTYGRWRAPQRVLFSKDGLAPGAHVMRIVATGTRNPKSRGSVIAVDAFTTVLAPPAVYQMHVNKRWSYDLGWGNFEGEAASEAGGSFVATVRRPRLGNADTTGPDVPEAFEDTVRLRLIASGSATPVQP